MVRTDYRSTFLLRLGVAFAFLCPPIDALFSPDSWIGYFPHFMRGFVPDSLLLSAWGLLEILVALWILSGKRVSFPATLATILLVSIVFFNLPQMEVVFRDLAIACMSATLAWWSYHEQFIQKNNATL